jgi:hypothetical protein
MADEQSLALRQADQIRTDSANVEIGLEMIMAQLARMPTRKELWRAALMGMLGGSALRSLWLSRSGVKLRACSST